MKENGHIKLAFALLEFLEGKELNNAEVSSILALALSMVIANAEPIDEKEGDAAIHELFEGICESALKLRKMYKEARDGQV